jgi:hypothetical protein
VFKKSAEPLAVSVPPGSDPDFRIEPGSLEMA